MATQQLTRTSGGHDRAGSVCSLPERRAGHDDLWLPAALRRTAERRKERADALRAWSQDVHPPLAQSLRRRAAELELGAVALQQRAEGMDGGTPHDDDEEDA